MNLLLADLVLLAHIFFVLFVVMSLPLVWVGAAADWRWVRHFGFRTVHLAAILIVSTEALAGIWCPLTILEDALPDHLTLFDTAVDSPELWEGQRTLMTIT